MDLIERQVAIDAVEFGITYAKAINKSTGEVKELFKEGNKALNEAVERLKELPSAQPESQWIPVAERLPEIKQRVLITYNTEDGLKTDVTWYDKYGFMLSGNVTAWMPMVEPYKKESGE